MGFANIVDSLYAVKKTVFDEKRFTMADLAEWLSQDWQDVEEKRVYLHNRVPKYGNDNDEVDAMAARVVDHYCDVLAEPAQFPGRLFLAGHILGRVSHNDGGLHRARRPTAGLPATCWETASPRRRGTP